MKCLTIIFNNMKIRISENKLFEAIKFVLEQEESEWVKLSPDEFLEYMKYADYDGDAVSQLRQFRGKNIWITGSLRLNGTRTESLGNVKKIDGNLDIFNTEIKSLSGIDIKGYVSKWNTPIDRAEKKRIRDGKLAEIESRREDKEWEDLTIDEAAKATALMNYLVSNNDLEFRDESDEARLVRYRTQLELLKQEEAKLDDEGQDTSEVVSEIEGLEEEIEDIEDKPDIYNLYPFGSHYDMTTFTVIGADYSEEHEFAVGTQGEIDRSMSDYFDGLVDEGITNMFRRDYLEDYIDEDKVEEYAREYYEEDASENPEYYCSEDDRELSDEQEDKIAELNRQRSELYDRQVETEDRDEYDELQSQIDDIDYEIEEIRENPEGDYSQEKVDEGVEDRIDDAIRNPMSWLRDFGMEDRIEDFVDVDRLKEDYISNEGYGVLNGYDNSYDEFKVNGEWYYVMRIN